MARLRRIYDFAVWRQLEMERTGSPIARQIEFKFSEEAFYHLLIVIRNCSIMQQLFT